MAFWLVDSMYPNDAFSPVGEGPIKMFLHQNRKALERLHPAPFEGVDPFPEEPVGSGPGPVLQKMAERLLEDMRLEIA